MLTRISAVELAEWQAFERIEGPIGSRRDDINTGWLAMHMVAPYRKDENESMRLADHMVPYEHNAESDRLAFLGGEVDEDSPNQLFGGGFVDLSTYGLPPDIIPIDLGAAIDDALMTDDPDEQEGEVAPLWQT